jgi:PAS domain S-box-containing protein
MSKLLLVEDNKIDQMAFDRFFATTSYADDFTIVDSVANALELLSNEVYDVVVVDYELGDGTGLDILQSMKQDVPVIVVTGAGSESVAIEALRLGAADYVIKDTQRSYLNLLPSIIERAVRAKLDEKMHITLSHAVINSGDSVCITDLDGTITFVNEAFCHMYGYDTDEVIGRKCESLYPSNEYQFEADEFTNFESVHQHSDGSHFNVSITRSQINDNQGKAFAFFISTREITQRIYIQEELRQSEQHLRSILDSHSTYVLRTDLEGNYTYVNNVTHEQHSWMYPNIEDMIGIPALETIIEEDRPRALEAGLECLKTPGKPVQVTLRKPTTEKGFFWGLWEFVAVTNSEGKSIEIQCVGIDITDHILAEERAFELSLEKERLNLLTTFIENVTHEFRTPLAIINSANSLINLVDDPLKRTNKTKKIEAEVMRISKLVDMLVLVAELEHQPTIETAPVDLNEITNLASRDLLSNHTNNPMVTTQLQPDLPLIDANSEFLLTAIQQIMDNASRYITAPASGEIRLVTRSSNEHVLLNISDTGIGIAEDDLPRIFDSFWRNDAAHSTPGFGLGLTIAKKIIELHQGEIIVNSEYGAGTRVEVKLPIYYP